MQKLTLTCCLVLFVFPTGSSAQGVAPAAATDIMFEFHSGFWVNLHHFLYEQATAGSLSPSYPPEWLTALAYYRREVIGRDLLADEAAQINNRLSSLETASSLKESSLAPELTAVLEAAAPIYRVRWWSDHDQANRAWMRAVEKLVSRYGDILRKELATIYATDWPSTPIRTDVVEYAKSAGAYTSLGPTHITVSGVNPGNQGNAALEILFHEASHALIAKVREALSKEVRAQNKLLRRRDLWHAVLFYTAGEMVRRRLDDYTPYAAKNGLYDRTWPGVPEILEADWKPYLDGKIDLITAVRRLVAAYSVSK
jgi:hypothetical protein